MTSREVTVTVINGSAPVANLFPITESNSGGSGSIDLHLLLWLLSVTLLVLGRNKYIASVQKDNIGRK
jgi:hypothetical protein